MGTLTEPVASSLCPACISLLLIPRFFVSICIPSDSPAAVALTHVLFVPAPRGNEPVLRTSHPRTVIVSTTSGDPWTTAQNVPDAMIRTSAAAGLGKSPVASGISMKDQQGIEHLLDDIGWKILSELQQ